MTGLKPFLPAGTHARIWRRRDRRRFEPSPSRHAELVVFVGMTGSIEYYIEGRIIRIEPRTVLFAFPGKAHFLMAESREADMVVGVLSQHLVGRLQSSPLPETQTERNPAPLLAKLSKVDFDKLRALSDELITTQDQTALEMGMGWWLHNLSQSIAGVGKIDHAQLHPSVGGAIEMINEDPSLPLSAVANAVGLTHTRLGQVFREEVGLTLYEFRLQRRLEVFAEIRDREPDTNLLQAAIAAGFGDYSSFYRAYTKYYGQTPETNRRRSNRKIRNPGANSRSV
ncbi:MAG: helix-turn-helix domain-containing protein [Rhizobiaceae bacterium]